MCMIYILYSTSHHVHYNAFYLCTFHHVMWRIIPLCNILPVHTFHQTKIRNIRHHIMQVKGQSSTIGKCKTSEALQVL